MFLFISTTMLMLKSPAWRPAQLLREKNNDGCVKNVREPMNERTKKERKKEEMKRNYNFGEMLITVLSKLTASFF